GGEPRDALIARSVRVDSADGIPQEYPAHSRFRSAHGQRPEAHDKIGRPRAKPGREHLTTGAARLSSECCPVLVRSRFYRLPRQRESSTARCGCGSATRMTGEASTLVTMFASSDATLLAVAAALPTAFVVYLYLSLPAKRGRADFSLGKLEMIELRRA